MQPKSNLRIALLTYSTKPRGSVIHTIELAEALQKLGHEVCIFALDKDGLGFERDLVCAFQAVSANPAPKEIDLLIKQRIQEFVDYLADYLEGSNLKFDIYHAQDCISANALAILRSQGHISHFVRTVHHIEDYNSPYLRDCQDRSIREAELCLCVSDSWQQQLYELYQIHAPRVINGVNLDRFSRDRNGTETQLQQKFGLTGSPIYLTVGGIEPRKNSIKLVQAFAQVLQDFPMAQLVIAGGSTLFDYQDYRQHFLTLVEELGISQSSESCNQEPIFAGAALSHQQKSSSDITNKPLVITGVMTDAELATLYRCADAFVFPSAKEGWGLVLMEAIASGLPVITSDCLPFTEFLSDQSALLVNPDDVAAIARAMALVLQPQISQSLVRNSQNVLGQYTWQNSAQMHTLHYQSIIKKCQN